MRKKITCRKIGCELKAAIALLAILILLPVLGTSASASLAITQSDLVNPLELGNVQTVLHVLDSNATVNLAMIQIAGQNYTLEKIQNVQGYTYSWQPDLLGSNSYILFFQNEEQENLTWQNQFVVIDSMPPQILASGPRDRTNSNPVEIYLTTNENAFCKYDSVNVSYDSMRSSFIGNTLQHSDLRNLQDGAQTYYARCRDTANNTGLPGLITFVLDSISPEITIYSPQGQTTTQSQPMKLATSEPATCRWGLVNALYDELQNTFQNTGGTLHENPVVLHEGVNQFFVACRDSFGNSASTKTVSAEYNIPPTASITIEKPDGQTRLAKGTFKLKLAASEPLKTAPALSFSCDSAASSIPLAGSGSSWEGYLEITSDSLKCTGAFSFLGTDLGGAQGQEITSGKLVLIDTRVPAVPSGLKAENYNNQVRISWSVQETEPDAVDRYNIYRSTTGNTDKNNLKYSTTQTMQYDSDIQNKIGYYYKVSSVSKSGVESALSQEVFVMVDQQNITTFKQDYAVSQLIESKIIALDGVISKLDGKIEFYDSASDAVKDVVLHEGLLQKMQSSKAALQLLVGELKSYRDSPIGLNDLKDRIVVIDSKIDSQQKLIPVDLVIKDVFSKESLVDRAILLKIAQDHIELAGLTPVQKKQYEEQIIALQERTRVSQSIVIYQVYYPGNTIKNGTLIKEKLLLPSGSSVGMLVQELIPKGTLKLSKAEYSQQPDDINLNGPIWLVKDLPGLEVSYGVPELLPKESVQDISSVILLDVAAFLDGLSKAAEIRSDEPITGNVPVEVGTSEDWVFFSTILLGCVLIALLIYYFISGGRMAAENHKDQMANKSTGLVSRSGLGDLLLQPTGQSGVMLELAKTRELLEKGDLKAAVEQYAVAKATYDASKSGFFFKLKARSELNSLYDELVARSI